MINKVIKGNKFFSITLLLCLIFFSNTAYADNIIKADIDSKDILLYEFESDIDSCLWNGSEYYITRRVRSTSWPRLKTQSIFTKDFKDLRKTLVDRDNLYYASYFFYNKKFGLYTAFGPLVSSKKENFPINTVLRKGRIDRYYNLNRVTSTDGVKWECVSGIRFEPEGWSSEVQLFEKDGKQVGFAGGCFISTEDGKNFTANDKTVLNDPYKLTPKDYLYLGYCLIDKSVLFNGKCFICCEGDYFGDYIERSEDGINWDIVYFNERTDEFSWYGGGYERMNFVDGDKFYIFNPAKPSYFISSNGIDWEEKSIPSTILPFKLNTEDLLISYKNGYFMFTYPEKVLEFHPTYGSIMLFSKDFENFVEVDMGTDVGYIKYIDNNILVSKNHVFDFKKIQKTIESAQSLQPLLSE